ncbi:MAG TPA: hypothetical protein VGH23_10795 [Rhizomicrobium sp.]|jgi:hypothetical protein
MHFARLVPHIDDCALSSGDNRPDAWPAPSEQDMSRIQQKNRLAIIMKEAAGAVVYSVGLVVLLLAVLTLLHAR